MGGKDRNCAWKGKVPSSRQVSHPPPQADAPKPAHGALRGHSEFRGGEIAIHPSKKWIEGIRKDLLAGGAEWAHSDSTSREPSERWPNALLPWTRKAHPTPGAAVYPGPPFQGSTPGWLVPSPEPAVFLQQLRICWGCSSSRGHLVEPQRASQNAPTAPALLSWRTAALRRRWAEGPRQAETVGEGPLSRHTGPAVVSTRSTRLSRWS